jgi:hypothetical protein
VVTRLGEPHPFVADADCDSALATWDAADLVNETPTSVENHDGFSPVFLLNSPQARITLRTCTLNVRIVSSGFCELHKFGYIRSARHKGFLG